MASERKSKVVYPEARDVFAALNLTAFEDVRCVILGQDPYHGPNQAHGLAFSVKPGFPRPPSLNNIFKEIETDLQVKMPDGGCLDGWANQGVLLLNSVLTVRDGEPGSHANKGWEKLTDKIIETVSDQKEKVAFFLWGKFAWAKAPLVDSKKHLILYAAHPSPLSAHRGFFGCKHFSQANEYLAGNGFKKIDWTVVS